MPNLLELALTLKDTKLQKFFVLYSLLSSKGQEAVANVLKSSDITVFLPSNEAVDRLLATDEGNAIATALGKKDSGTQNALLTIIAYHVAKGEYCRLDLINSKKNYFPTFLETFAGDVPMKNYQQLSIASWKEESEKTTLSGGKAPCDNHIMIDHAEVVSKAIKADNGIAYMIDAVLMPPMKNMTTLYRKNASCGKAEYDREEAEMMTYTTHKEKKMKKNMC